MLIITRNDDNALRTHRRNHRTIFQSDGTHGVHEFQMLTLRVIDQGYRGVNHCRQHGNFSGMIHTQLDNSNLVVLPQAQQGHRNANIVIQIAARGQRGAVRPFSGQDGGQHLRDRGFSVATRNGNQRHIVLRTPGVGQRAQREASVRNHDTGHAFGATAVRAAVTKRRHRSTLLRLLHKVVGVIVRRRVGG